jgi:transposase
LTVASDHDGHERLLECPDARGGAPLCDRGLPSRLRAWSGELIARGEHVVRVPPNLMAGARGSQREFGESAPIDSLTVAQHSRARVRLG